jgi:hypothetical protein
LARKQGYERFHRRRLAHQIGRQEEQQGIHHAPEQLTVEAPKGSWFPPQIFDEPVWTKVGGKPKINECHGNLRDSNGLLQFFNILE